MSCRVDGCDRPIRVISRQLCNRHYRRWQRSGSPEGTLSLRPPEGSSQEEAFAWYRPGDPPVGPDECWDWQGSVDAYGYGQLRGKKAHRLSYEIHAGAIPEGLGIRHTCDRPICVAPQHLIPGTQRQNTDDALDRDRIRRGERHGQAKLTEDQVVEMRKRHAAGESARSLSQVFGVGAKTAWQVVNRTTWKHVI